MTLDRLETLEAIQRLAVRLIATSPAGEGLRLVGGLRYRLLDGSCRSSIDIDYHWDGSLERKRDEVLSLFRKKLLPELRQRLGHDGTVEPFTGPDAVSPAVKTIVLAAYRLESPGSRIEVPVDITRIACLDPPVARTAQGTVYLTASDADMAESKVIALLERTFTQDRDLLDLFLFQDELPADARARLGKKLARLSVSRREAARRLRELHDASNVHSRGIDRILEEQVDAPAAASLRSAGGGKMVCDLVLKVLDKLLGRVRR